MPYEKAAVKFARLVREAREHSGAARSRAVAEVVAEFDGDPAKMSEEILYWRRRLGA
jgi:hypothetical protein